MAPENSMDLILFAFRTNFKLWRECCSLSESCWTIWMDECVEFDKQYGNGICHVQMGATVGCGRCYIVDLNDEQDRARNWTLWYSLWQGYNTECPRNHIIMTRKGTTIPLFVFAFFLTGVPETNSKIAWPNNFHLLPSSQTHHNHHPAFTVYWVIKPSQRQEDHCPVQHGWWLVDAVDHSVGTGVMSLGYKKWLGN